MVVAAIVGSAVVGAAGSAIAGSEAAGATEDATAAQLLAQREALAQQERLTAPYRAFGEQYIPEYNRAAEGSGAQGATARNQMMRLLGIGPQGQLLNPRVMQNALRQTPGYQFAAGEGNRAAMAQAAAAGMGLSGNTLQALSKYNQNLADLTYQQQLGNYSNAYQNTLANALAPINIGQAAASNQAANVGAAGVNMANIYGQQGANQAGIAANTIGGVTGAIGGGIQNYLLMNTLQGLQGGAAAGGGGGFTNPGALGINSGTLFP